MPRARPLLLLWGFMGSGKSTLGRAIAARAQVPFVDLDERIAAEAHLSIAAIFEQQGENTFRALERRALEQLLDRNDRAVVALGGGALVDDTLRARALRDAFVVTLTAPFDVLLERIRESDRPLLPNAEHLWKQRQAAYTDTHALFDTSTQEIEELTEALLNIWVASA